MRALPTCVLVLGLWGCSAPATHVQTPAPGLRLRIASDEGNVRWQVASEPFRTAEELQAELRRSQHRGRSVVIETGPAVTYADVARTVDVLSALGYEQIHFAGSQGLER